MAQMRRVRPGLARGGIVNALLQLVWYCVAAAFMILLLGVALGPLFWNKRR